MVRKKIQTTPLQPSSNYWESFLESQGLSGSTLHQPQLKQSPFTETKEPEGKLTGDMFTFSYRVAERLTPLDGLGQEARARCLKIRQQYRNELRSVFLGKENFDDWFTRTKTARGFHYVNFIRILYECLTGLNSTEAKDLRMAYGQTLQKIAAGMP